MYKEIEEVTAWIGPPSAKTVVDLYYMHDNRAYVMLHSDGDCMMPISDELFKAYVILLFGDDYPELDSAKNMSFNTDGASFDNELSALYRKHAVGEILLDLEN